MVMNNNLLDIYHDDSIEKSELYIDNRIGLYDSMTVNPLYSYFNYEDINEIRSCGFNLIKLNEFMEKRGFKFLTSGTNRRVYTCNYDNRIIAKIAIDSSGRKNNLDEYQTQASVRPFCCKIFEVSQDGSIAIIERVTPIVSYNEWCKFTREIYIILKNIFANNGLAIEDIGIGSWKNWGYREGFGPVLIDYPTVFVYNKNIRCNAEEDGVLCQGRIMYNDSFDFIECKNCGKRYIPRDLAIMSGTLNVKDVYSFRLNRNNNTILDEYDGGENDMKISIKALNKTIEIQDVNIQSTITRPNSVINEFTTTNDCVNHNRNKPGRVYVKALMKDDKKDEYKPPVIQITHHTDNEQKDDDNNEGVTPSLDDILNDIRGGNNLDKNIKRFLEYSNRTNLDLFNILLNSTVSGPLESGKSYTDKEEIYRTSVFLIELQDIAKVILDNKQYEKLNNSYKEDFFGEYIIHCISLFNVLCDKIIGAYSFFNNIVNEFYEILQSKDVFINNMNNKVCIKTDTLELYKAHFSNVMWNFRTNMTTGKVVPSYVYNEFDREIIIDSYNPDQLTLISNERDDNGWEDSLPFTSVETIDMEVNNN